MEAFATVREVSRRTLGLRHFDVQLMGGIVLHQAKIAEMRTGEGKTLTSTLPIYLNALAGEGVHVITVNDYLAKRDSEWMQPIYNFLGLSVGVIVSDLPAFKRKAAYAADITYGTNNEFGFDYLRDNMALSLEEQVQRKPFFAMIDEVDSVLIDEARTPLIISGPSETSSDLYFKINEIVPKLRKTSAVGEKVASDVSQPKDPQLNVDGDFTLDEKQRQAYLTESGHQYLEDLLLRSGLLPEGESLYSATQINLMHHVNAALRAHHLYHNEVDYIIQNNQAVIVDEHTGRTMPGRRWSDGLHQAIEAKEGLAISGENQTLASITFQNYFRLYEKISGMTGTADTEAYEFQQIYNLEVVVIPTNRVMIRNDLPDEVYINQKAKFSAIITDIQDCVKRRQPVLVGTASIEASEHLSNLLKRAKIAHKVLNAKYHQQEANIIVNAGKPGAVTIATNMAGRGTDIVLGGHLAAAQASLSTDQEKAAIQQAWAQDQQTVIAVGGLRIIGSERHESRRIDNQLRGRSGRQGDPGSSRFYLALDDHLMRIFASEKIAGLMRYLGMEENIAITHAMVNRAIENAQRKVEAFHFDIRKQLLEYDNVANQQRQAIYMQRRELLETGDLRETIEAILKGVIRKLLELYLPETLSIDEWRVSELENKLKQDFLLEASIQAQLSRSTDLTEIVVYLEKCILDHYRNKRDRLGVTLMQQVERSIMLQILDVHWREHLQSMDHLRQGIHLRGYAQKDPKQEYKREAFILFSDMLESIKYSIATYLIQIEISEMRDLEVIQAEERARFAQFNQSNPEFLETAALDPKNNSTNMDMNEDPAVETLLHRSPKVGRNAVCPCGSGKKYKHCHG